MYYSNAILIIIRGICMKADGKKQREIIGSENRLLKELGKGIDSMENGRTVPHNKAI